MIGRHSAASALSSMSEHRVPALRGDTGVRRDASLNGLPRAAIGEPLADRAGHPPALLSQRHPGNQSRLRHMPLLNGLPD